MNNCTNRLLQRYIWLFLAVIIFLFCATAVYAEADYTINRSSKEAETEYKSDQSNSAGTIRQNISFNAIEISGITGLKEPELQQDTENHITKYVFAVDDSMTVTNPVNIQFDTYAEYTTSSGTSEKKQPVIVTDQSTLESANADSEENIREVTLDMALLNELGSVSCTVFYKFGTYNKNRYQLQIIFQKVSTSTSYTINRSSKEAETEYKSDQSNSAGTIRQNISFNAIEISGITGLKEPELQQDTENHITKYVFAVDDSMTVTNPVNIQFDTYAEYTTSSGTSEKKQPVIVTDQSTLESTNADSEENIREVTLDMALLNELGSVSCTVFYKFGTYNKNRYQLQIIFQKGESDDGSLLKGIEAKDKTGTIVDDYKKTKSLAMVASNNRNNMTLELKTASGIIPVVCSANINSDGDFIEGDAVTVTTDSNTHTMQLQASTKGLYYLIKLKYGDTVMDQYAITVYKREFNDLPDEVVDYMCAPSQYVNGIQNVYGKNRTALLSLRGANTYSTTSEELNTAPFSLGNFGGYVTYFYEDAITDDPKNPYGIDFIIAGNSIINDALYAEPGNVYVSDNGTDWYILAGSLHYDDDAIWDASVKYEKNEDGTTKVTLPDQTVIDSYRQYPIAANYPLFAWDDDNKSTMTLSGLMLKPDKTVDSYNNIVPPYPAFGYADCGTPSYSNEADNPYTGVGIGSTNKVESSGRKDGFDLAWAVDSNGKPHKFNDGIHYIKIQTNTFIENSESGINEKSTEINFMRRAESASQPVGNTYDIEKDSNGKNGINITVDGKQMELREGQYEYDAQVDGIFDVQVDTRLDSNVYINSWHGNKATFDKAAHDIVRVIIQRGSCEPAIYYINITQEQDDNEVTAVTFDAGKGEGLISGYTKRTQYYDKDSSVKDFPIPKHRTDKVFSGWLDKDGNRYTGYSEDMPSELTLTADWREPLDNAKLIEEITKQIEEIQKQLDQVIAEAESTSAESSETISQQAAKISELTESLNEAQEKLKEATEQSTLDNAALEKAKEELATATKALEQAQKQIEQAEEAKKAAEEAVKQAEADKKAAEDAAKQAEADKKTAEDAAKQSEADKKAAEDAAKQASSDNDAALEALKKAQEELALAKTEVERLKVKALKVKGVKVKTMKKKAKVSWKTLGKGYRYEVFKSTKKNKGFKKAKTVKSVKVTLKKLKSGKRYYFKVRAFKKLNGKKVYTGYSKVVKAKIK